MMSDHDVGAALRVPVLVVISAEKEPRLVGDCRSKIPRRQ